MSIPKYYAVGVRNDSGANWTGVIKGTPWKYKSDGTKEYGATVTLKDDSASAIATANGEVGPEQDNTPLAAQWDGIDCWVQGTAGTGASAVQITLVYGETGALPSDPRSGVLLFSPVPAGLDAGTDSRHFTI